MSNIIRTIFALMIVGFVATAQEEDYAVAMDFQLDNASQYVWRGIVINDEQVMQPSVTASVGGFSLNVWGNFDMTDTGLAGNDEFSEVDYTLAYNGEVDAFNFGIGAVYYDYIGGNPREETAEVFGSIGFDVMLNPTLTVYYDFDEADGFYGTLGVGHSIPLNDEETFTFDLAAKVAYADGDYNEYYYGVDDHGFVDVVGSVGLAYAITENIGVGISVSYSELLDNDIEDNADFAYGDSDAFWTTWSVSVGF